MGKVGAVAMVAFAVTLALVAGLRMSAEAMAVVVGVVCGVAAGIPLAVLLMVAIRPRERPAPPELLDRPGQYPPVVVIQGGSQIPAPAQYLPAIEMRRERTIRIVGEE